AHCRSACRRGRPRLFTSIRFPYGQVTVPPIPAAVRLPGDLLRASNAPAGGAGHLRLTSTRPWLRYQANGLAAHSNLTVNACAGDQLRGKVVVNRLGRVRTERPRRKTDCP